MRKQCIFLNYLKFDMITNQCTFEILFFELKIQNLVSQWLLFCIAFMFTLSSKRQCQNWRYFITTAWKSMFEHKFLLFLMLLQTRKKAFSSSCLFIYFCLRRKYECLGKWVKEMYFSAVILPDSRTTIYYCSCTVYEY